MKRIAFLVISMLLSALCVHAQAPKRQGGTPEPPGLEYVCELRVICEGTYTVGQTSHGTRVVIPIVGGTFEGPDMKGTILSGGADYQLVDSEHSRNEIEAIYSIKTDDGVYIHIRNTGIIYTGPGKDGQRQFYFRLTPRFEAPQDSKYAWLNNSVFICMNVPATDCICLRVWRVL